MSVRPKWWQRANWIQIGILTLTLTVTILSPIVIGGINMKTEMRLYRTEVKEIRKQLAEHVESDGHKTTIDRTNALAEQVSASNQFQQEVIRRLGRIETMLDRQGR